jgi:hypothetical protein
MESWSRFIRTIYLVTLGVKVSCITFFLAARSIAKRIDLLGDGDDDFMWLNHRVPVCVFA